MYSIEDYKKLTSKYGIYASWAIWNYKNSNDTTIIDQNFEQLHSKYILLGLNISRPLNKKWANFHDNTHARKLNYACNGTKIRGSYMTDLFKGIVKSRSTNFENILTDKIISENVDFFNQEMVDIKIDCDSQFIIFGAPISMTARLFNEYYKNNYRNHTIYYYHYSYFTLTDREWVSGFWKKLNINQNYDLTIMKYR
jgi:hypothetical protein